MHTLMDLNGSIPTFIRLTEASVHDSKILEEVPVEPNAYYLMDKGYDWLLYLQEVSRQSPARCL